MQHPERILYVGTYERDYPRNALTIAAFRLGGYVVEEIHASVWFKAGDKVSLLGSPLALLRLLLCLVRSYVVLALRLAWNLPRADLVVVGYIGQLDLLVLGPLVRLMRRPILFNPLITLTDTLIEDRQVIKPNGVVARAIRGVDRLVLKLSDAILVDTPENGAFLVERFGVRPDRLFTIPVGADEQVFVPSDVQPPDGLVDSACRPGVRVLFYGTMIPLQGVDTIVRAAKLLERDFTTRFEIIGDGQTYPAVRALVEELHVTNMHFAPHVPFDELPSRIARADIVLGIFGDTQKAARVVPNKVYQAMAMGAAIVTRDSAAARRLLTGPEAALLVPPGDAAALAAAIRRLADPVLRRRLGQEARARFQSSASLAVQAADLAEAVDATLARATRRRVRRVQV